MELAIPILFCPVLLGSRQVGRQQRQGFLDLDACSNSHIPFDCGSPCSHLGSDAPLSLLPELSPEERFSMSALRTGTLTLLLNTDDRGGMLLRVVAEAQGIVRLPWPYWMKGWPSPVT